jgi:epoxyqueuosine reductase QueG
MGETLTTELKDMARREGADVVGIARVASFSEAPQGHRPENILRRARSVVVMATHLLEGSLEAAPSREYSVTYQVVNQELNRLAFQVARFLERQGYRALQVPASQPYDHERNMGDLSHRHAGQIAGIGVLGKNSLLLSPKFGPRMRLVSVITDAPLEADAPLRLDLCKDCDQCLRTCPSSALKGGGVVDKMACDAYHVTTGERLHLNDAEQICGVCVRICPIGKADVRPVSRSKES